MTVTQFNNAPIIHIAVSIQHDSAQGKDVVVLTQANGEPLADTFVDTIDDHYRSPYNGEDVHKVKVRFERGENCAEMSVAHNASTPEDWYSFAEITPAAAGTFALSLKTVDPASGMITPRKTVNVTVAQADESTGAEWTASLNQGVFTLVDVDHKPVPDEFTLSVLSFQFDASTPKYNKTDITILGRYVELLALADQVSSDVLTNYMECSFEIPAHGQTSSWSFDVTAYDAQGNAIAHDPTFKLTRLKPTTVGN
ncbi:MAG: hypothetical protein AAGF11_22365 [Myxococcota bacterium]